MLLNIIQYISQIILGLGSGAPSTKSCIFICHWLVIVCTLLLIKLLAIILAILLINFTCSFVLQDMLWYIDKNLEKTMSCKYREYILMGHVWQILHLIGLYIFPYFVNTWLAWPIKFPFFLINSLLLSMSCVNHISKCFIFCTHSSLAPFK